MRFINALWVVLWACHAVAVSVQDDTGRTITLTRPATRVVSLAPHTTELLFAAGAGAQVVGVSAWSDYPAAATTLPQVGGAQGLSIERILALKPDLVVGWASGNAARDLARLRSLEISLFLSEPSTPEDVAADWLKLGQLTGHEAQARAASAQFSARFATLQAQYRHAPSVKVFIQLNAIPLMTVNHKQILSRLVELCGGRNVFADLLPLVPQVSVEAVLAKKPDVILTPGPVTALQSWRRWPDLPAVRNQQLHGLPDALVSRQGPRLIEGAYAVCHALHEEKKTGIVRQ